MALIPDSHTLMCIRAKWFPSSTETKLVVSKLPFLIVCVFSYCKVVVCCCVVALQIVPCPRFSWSSTDIWIGGLRIAFLFFTDDLVLFIIQHAAKCETARLCVTGSLFRPRISDCLDCSSLLGGLGVSISIFFNWQKKQDKTRTSFRDLTVTLTLKPHSEPQK